MDAYAGLGCDYLYLGQFEKSLEYFDKAIRLSPHDPASGYWYDGKAVGLFRAEAVRSGDRMGPPGDRDQSEFRPVHASSSRRLALTGHEAEAREALQRYLALPSSAQLKTIAAWKAFQRPDFSDLISRKLCSSSRTSGCLSGGLERRPQGCPS